ncbi:MAG TPA: efflux RND transporter periplasmic adaptor subunit [Planctomycetaceae bacterium]|jgi:multidrug efflux system membrane fusion protein|nr:efflux RND transporter periplasmic adaptor subunit [Planctomycetaceae bacterium]
MTTVQPPKYDESIADSAPPRETAAHLDQLHAPLEKETTPGRRGWLWLILLLAALGAGGYLVHHFNLLGTKTEVTAKAARPVPVVAATVTRGDVNLYLSGLLGTVTAFQTATVRTRVDGQIMKVYFTEGQMIKADEPLVEIDPRPYQVQLAQSEGQLARDQASLTQAKQDLVRDVELLKTKSVTPQTYDAQVSLVGQYEGAVKTDLAAIASAKLNITYCHITAPFSGRIGLRLVDMGNFVQAASQTSIAVITQLQPIAVIFPVPQDDIFRVQQKFNSSEDIVVDALNRDLTAKLATGKLLAIDNQVDVTTGTVKLKAVFQNEDNLLFPNEFVSSRLLIDTKRNVVLVPTAAVQHGPDSTFAFVLKLNKDAKPTNGAPAKTETKSNTAAKSGKDAKTGKAPKPDYVVEMRQLTVGPSQNEQTIVEKGLSPGEMVVTEGTDKLQDGSHVELRGRRKSGTGQQQPAAPAGTNTESGKSTAQAVK